MNIIELMNYRYENPENNVNVDSKITESFISRNREQENLENFELWGSLSKESEKIEKLISSYKMLKQEENVVNITR